jgi:hypothetical protein
VRTRNQGDEWRAPASLAATRHQWYKRRREQLGQRS